LSILGPALAARPASAAAPPRTFIEADSVLVHGTYPPLETECAGDERAPLHLRLTGRVEIGKASDGTLFVINELPFETYLEGIAEVPRDWPAAALDAQVVAARTYALSRLERGDSTGDVLGYDLCATDACQVYRGLGVSHGAWGSRWREAVARTAGTALLHDGHPAETFYFSTSNGQTYDNEEVFEGGTPLPYLRGVSETDDGASPVSRWTARLPLADVGGFLAASGDWPGGDVAAVSQDGDNLVIRGGGRQVTMSKVSFRIAINDRSVCLDPASYPGVDHEQDDRPGLPQTIPSKWFDARTDGRDLVVDGRGWGHGTGMVQWGAFGKARRGVSADEILAYYYGGLKPRDADVPATIRVGVATGLTSVTVAADSPSARGKRLRGSGPWRIVPARPLRVTAAKNPAPVLEARLFGPPMEARAGRRSGVGIEASANVNVSVALVEPDGTAHPLPAVKPHRRGTFTRTFIVPAGLPSGDYRVTATVSDGIDTLVLRAKRQTSVESDAPEPGPSPTGGPVALPPASAGESPAGLALVFGAIALVLLLASLIVVRRHRRSPG
jgi:stage II sporulation protein D